MMANNFQNMSNTLLCNLSSLGERLEEIRESKKNQQQSSTADCEAVVSYQGRAREQQSSTADCEAVISYQAGARE